MCFHCSFVKNVFTRTMYHLLANKPESSRCSGPLNHSYSLIATAQIFSFKFLTSTSSLCLICKDCQITEYRGVQKVFVNSDIFSLNILRMKTFMNFDDILYREKGIYYLPLYNLWIILYLWNVARKCSEIQSNPAAFLY